MLETLQNAGLEFWQTLCEMAPYLLFGFFAAGLLSILISPKRVEEHLGGHGFWPVIKAALFGIPLPLCSCSVIPVTASLRKHGASRGAATAFLISTPQTGVDSIFVTLSLLGPVFAIFKPLAAFVSGVLGGGLVDVLEPHGEADTHVPEECQDACCAENGQGKLARAFSYAFIDLPRDIGKPLLIGVAVAGIIGALAPENFFARIGIGTGVLAILIMMLLGIPIYVCATASIPVAAALLMKGVSPGAVLAFLMTGPATNAAGIATVWKILGRRTALVYLGTVMVTALGAGLLLDFLFKVTTSAAEPWKGWMLPNDVKVACAGALLAVLALSFVRSGSEAHDHDEGDEEHDRCEHCADDRADECHVSDDNDQADACCR